MIDEVREKTRGDEVTQKWVTAYSISLFLHINVPQTSVAQNNHFFLIIIFQSSRIWGQGGTRLGGSHLDSFMQL